MLTWPILRDFSDYYFACPDTVSARGMRFYAAPVNGDAQIVSGESGAVTGGLVSLLLEKCECSILREKLHITEDSVILLFNTEGDTDPEGYRKIVLDGAHPL